MLVKNNKKGFTLLEMVIAMAIISILAAGILVSLDAQRKRVQSARALAEMSSVIQPIMMCLSDGGTITAPSGSTNPGPICSKGASYGSWPVVDLGSLSEINAYTSSNSASFTSGAWWFYNTVNGTTLEICCNGKSSRCAVISTAVTCDANVDLSQYH